MVLELIEGEKGSVTHDDATTYAVETELTINAPSDKVWGILTDFDKIADWSPGMIKFEGEFRLNGPAKVTFLIGIGQHTQTFEHPLIYFEEGHMFGWSAPLPYMHMSDNHKYIVEPIDEKSCKIIQTDQFHGHGAHLVGAALANGTRPT